MTSPARNRSTPPRPARARPTAERILDAAERLFAEHGIEAVSVRSVLAEAGVNVALAHRHFGSRDGLVDALVRRAVAPLNAERLRLLALTEARGRSATLEDVLRAFYPPAMRWIFEHPDRARLLAHIQASPNDTIRALHRKHFMEIVPRFAEAIQARLPRHLGPAQRVCRFYFVLGSGLMMSLHWAEVARVGRERFGPAGVPDVEVLSDEIVAFCAAGLRAPPDRRHRRRTRRHTRTR
jgi:AcrR family transcriptional regulator